jgi:hypothetical protein
MRVRVQGQDSLRKHMKESQRPLLGFGEGLENAEEDRQDSHECDRRADPKQ